MKLCDYGFPVLKTDLRMSVKSYLENKGINDSQFIIPSYTHGQNQFLE